MWRLHASRSTLALAGVAVSCAALAAGLSAAPVSAEESNRPSAARGLGSVYVVQALPDVAISMSIDGQQVRQGVSTGSVIGPLRLSPGKHSVTITGEDPDWVMKASVRVTANGSADVVLHRPASVGGAPTVTVYRNPIAGVPDGKGRVMVAHTATVPPADVTVDGRVVFANIANGEFATAEVPAGEHKVAIWPTGRTGPALLGPVELTAKAATLTQVFAVGRPTAGTMDVIVHTLPLRTRGSAAPDMVNTGSAGLVAGVPLAQSPR